MENSLENNTTTFVFKKKFDTVLSELKDIKLINGETSRVMSFNNNNNSICSRYYAFLGFKNELSSSLIYIEPNKWYGSYKEELTMVKASKYYEVFSESTNQVFLTLPIHSTFTTEHNELYFIVQKPNCYEIRQKLKNYRNLPKRKQNYILNLKSGVCSCLNYKKFKNCCHYHLVKKERMFLRKYLIQVLIEKIGKSIAFQIGFTCNF